MFLVSGDVDKTSAKAIPGSREVEEGCSIASFPRSSPVALLSISLIDAYSVCLKLDELGAMKLQKKLG